MTNQSRKPRQMKPVSGTTRWIEKPSGPHLWGRIAITNANGETREYDFRAFLEGGKVVGFGLAKDDDEIYSIGITRYGWECDCPDANWNNRECKHAKAVRAALSRLGIDVPSALKQEAPALCAARERLGIIDATSAKPESPQLPVEEKSRVSVCPYCEKSFGDCECWDNP
jgi:hypothetical protein